MGREWIDPKPGVNLLFKGWSISNKELYFCRHYVFVRVLLIPYFFKLSQAHTRYYMFCRDLVLFVFKQTSLQRERGSSTGSCIWREPKVGKYMCVYEFCGVLIDFGGIFLRIRYDFISATFFIDYTKRFFYFISL